MSRYERRMFFESLCHLRDRYAATATTIDRTGVMTVEDAIAWATIELDTEVPAEAAAEPQPADERKR